MEDKSGNLWFGTYGGGVSKYDGNRVDAIEAAMQRGETIPERTQQDLKKINGKLVKSFTHFTEKEGLSNNVVRSILEDKSGNLWFGTYGGGVRNYDGNRVEAIEAAMQRGETIPERTLQDLKRENGKLVKSFTHFTEKEGLSNNAVLSMLEDKSGNLWFGSRFGLSELKVKNLKLKVENPERPFFKNYTYEDGFLGIGVNGGKTICEDKNGTIWVAANDRLTAYHPEGELADTVAPNIQLTSIALFNENIKWANLQNSKVKSQNSKEENIAADTSFTLGNGVSVGNFEFDGITKWYSLPENLSLAYNNNYITFNFIGITQKQSKKVKYQYKLEGIDENWSAITNRTEAPYGNLPQGTYSFKIKAMNSEGYWSNEFNYTFTIRPPWWKTWWFRSLVIGCLLLVVWLFFRWRTAALRKEKIILEEKVEKRTHELAEKTIVAEANEKDAISQRHLVEEKQKEIIDSINYAERIQRSFLATKELLDENLKDYFVFFQPKDVVSGDFYWASKLNNGNFVLVTADSTGHGVPGAIMSILNISCLENAVKEGVKEPAEILNHTRINIIERLKKDGSADGGKDGMDASLICFDFKNNKLNYSAANNPIWIVRENQLLEFSPDKMPVGKHDKDSISFIQHEVSLEKGDLIYALTDGMPDQFGGPKGKKFMYKQLKELLICISTEPMEIQKQKLSDALNNWKGNMEQVDDITLIGIRV